MNIEDQQVIPESDEVVIQRLQALVQYLKTILPGLFLVGGGEGTAKAAVSLSEMQMVLDELQEEWGSSEQHRLSLTRMILDEIRDAMETEVDSAYDAVMEGVDEQTSAEMNVLWEDVVPQFQSSYELSPGFTLSNVMELAMMTSDAWLDSGMWEMDLLEYQARKQETLLEPIVPYHLGAVAFQLLTVYVYIAEMKIIPKILVSTKE